MDTRLYEIPARADSEVKIRVIPGHFATNHSHINHYVDLTLVKTQHKTAAKAATILAGKYQSVHIDTIICLEGTEMIGAFLAEELTRPGLVGMNTGSNINVLAPELNSNNQMVFRENTQKMVTGKAVLLLIATASTGKTIRQASDCIRYYEGNLVGISALFSAVSRKFDTEINSVFSERDLPDYRTYPPPECELCAQKQRIDAIANSFGYSKL